MENGINPGDTAWIMVSIALVTLMTPALGFFYGGMVRRKNILSTLNLSFITMGLISLQWVLFGYSLAFG
ncbi:MAG: ammonium transporter, partial [Caldilineaceae bacterium]|nr:ammonium transporter [Caldilineaceae bacterium]